MARTTKKKTSKNGAGGGSVRDRLNVKKGGKKEPKRLPGKIEDYLAAQLHEERARVMELKKTVLFKDQEILKLKEENLKLQVAVVNAEQANINKQNAELREKHSLTLGGSIHLDDETGEVYRLEGQG